MGRLRRSLVDWWRRRRLTAPRLDQLVRVESQAEIPLELPRHGVVVVGSAARPKRAVFACPCGRGHVVTLNLSTRREPSWELRVSERGRPGLEPSIDVQEGPRRCHFWLRDGRVRWS